MQVAGGDEKPLPVRIDSSFIDFLGLSMIENERNSGFGIHEEIDLAEF